MHLARIFGIPGIEYLKPTAVANIGEMEWMV
jgi:hypothetical protein